MRTSHRNIFADKKSKPRKPIPLVQFAIQTMYGDQHTHTRRDDARDPRKQRWTSSLKMNHINTIPQCIDEGKKHVRNCIQMIGVNTRHMLQPNTMVKHKQVRRVPRPAICRDKMASSRDATRSSSVERSTPPQSAGM